MNNVNENNYHRFNFHVLINVLIVTPSTRSGSSSGGSTFGSAKQKWGKGLYSGGYANSPKRGEPGGMKFTMAEIQKATKNFNPTLKIGQGGSGMVYKGQLDDGTLVAVKRAKKVRSQRLI